MLPVIAVISCGQENIIVNVLTWTSEMLFISSSANGMVSFKNKNFITLDVTKAKINAKYLFKNILDLLIM